VDALGAFARDDHRIARLAVVLEHAFAARGEQALGGFAHHDKIDVLRARIAKR
jgi:hypothetical protein